MCCTDTDCFIIHIKAEDVYKDISPDVEKWFDTATDIVDRPLPIGKSKKDELFGRTMTKFVGLRPKTFLFNR